MAVDETASTVETGGPVSIENIFTDDGSDKKVIVLQTQASSSDPSGGLPDLTDAVADPSQPQAASEVPYEPQAEMPAEENHSGSAETVSAPETYEELNNSTDASAKIDQPDPNFVTEAVQDIHTIAQNSEEVIFLDEEQVKDQDIQFIEMTSEIAPESIDQPSETVMENVVFAPQQQIQVSGFKRELGRPLRLSETIQPMPRKTTFISKEDIKTRFLCPVCEKSFRQKHLLLCHLKLHDSPAKTKSTSVYMSNCTTCGGNVRLTSEQARLLQERGTEDARIICSTCKLLGHDVMQPKTQNTPIELKPAYNFNCDLCGCDIKLTDDQLQLVDRKGAENIRIICAPCSTKDQESISANPGLANFKCTSCQRMIVLSSQESIDPENPTCAECQAKYASEENAAVENMQEEPVNSKEEPDLYQYMCTICSKESYMNIEPQTPSDLICPDCKIPERYRRPATVRQPTSYSLTPTGRQPRFPHVKGVRELKPPGPPKVDGLAVMYKCNSCFCSMQVSEEQKQVLKARGVSGLKIICSACNSKGKPSPAKKKLMNLYQCDICLNDMDIGYVPSHDDDDIICQTCRKVEQKDRMKRAKGDLFKCITCNKYLPLTNTQMTKILQRSVRPNLQCDPCRKKTLHENDGKKYASLSSQKAVDYRCDICGLHFGANFDKFANHFEKMHIPAKTQAPKKMTIRCPICEYNFTDREKLKLHIRTHKPKRLMERPCPFCGEQFSKKNMYEHYKSTHSVNIENEMYIFKFADEFKNWKEETEASTCSKFICTDQKANVVKNMPTINLKCQWASLYKTKLVKSRTCVFCPANIEIRVTRNGIFTVNFTKTHVGHELLSDDFSLEEIELMRGYLREGKTVDDIVNELCKELNTESEEYSRFYQLKNYDEYCLSLKLGDIDLIRKFKREDMSEDSVDGGSDCDLKADWVDLPNALDFLKDDALYADQSNSIDTPHNVTATVDIEGTADQCSLTFQAPPIVEQFPFGQKKMEILRRMTALLNKCSSDEHFDILDIYLSPCEQTLTELSSGKKVEVVGDDELEVTSEAQNDGTESQADLIDSQNDVTEVEDVTSAMENEVTIEEVTPPSKRAKTESE